MVADYTIEITNNNMDDSDETRNESRSRSSHQHHPPLQDKETRNHHKRRRVMRDNLQKKVHNVVEQKRKAKMAAWISDINSLLPKSDPRKDSINLVLERAYQFILELKESNDKLMEGKFTDVERAEIDKLKQEISHLKDQNERYLKLLKLAGISPLINPPDANGSRNSSKSVHQISTDETSSSEDEVVHCRHRRPRRRTCHRRCQSDSISLSNNNNSTPQIVVIRADMPAATPAPAIASEVTTVDQSAITTTGANLIIGSNLLPQTGATFILTSNGQLLPVAQVVTTESAPSLAQPANCSPSSFSTNNLSQSHSQPLSQTLQQNGQQNNSTTPVPIIATSSHNFHVSSLLNDGGSTAADAPIPIEPIDSNQVGSRITSSCNTTSNDFFHSMGQPVSSMRNSFRSNNFHVNNLLTDVLTAPASDQNIQSSVTIEGIDHNQMGNRSSSFCSSNSSDYYQPRGQQTSSNTFRVQTYRSNNFHVNNLLTDNSAPGVDTTVHSNAATEMIDKSTTRSSAASYNTTNQTDYYQSRGQTPSSWMNPMSRW